MATIAPIRIEALRELIAAGSVRSVTLLGQRGGWAVTVRVGLAERVLANRQGDPRLFATLDASGRALRALGVAEFAVDAVAFEAGRLRPARPDRRDALRHLHALAREK